MKITDISVTLLAHPDLDPNACDSAQNTVLVQIATDEGITGIGEVDATTHVVAAFLTPPSGHVFALGMRDFLVGEDPLESRRLWHKLYEGTIMSGHRGMGECSHADQLLTHRTAEQLPNGRAVELATDVPQSHIYGLRSRGLACLPARRVCAP